MKNNQVIKGLLFLFLAQSMVGINIVSSKFLLTDIPALILLEIRFLLATLILFPMHFLTPRACKLSLSHYFNAFKSRDWLFIIAQALTAGVLFNIFMLTGLSYTDANVAGIITSALPAIIALLSWVILKTTISASKIMCILLATLGLIIIAYSKFTNLSADHSFYGDGLILFALLPEALYYVLAKIYPNQLPLFLASALLNGINALVLLPILFFIPWDMGAIKLASFALLILIGLSSGLFYIFWFLGAKSVDNIMASLSTAIMPVSTVFLAFIFLGESLSRAQLMGMTLVLFSILFYVRK